MVNEFRNVSYRCSPSDLVPSGPEYTNITNQVCTVAGSRTGEELVLGISYLQAQYGFEKSHLWRNVGINAAIFVFLSFCSGLVFFPRIFVKHCVEY